MENQIIRIRRKIWDNAHNISGTASYNVDPRDLGSNTTAAYIHKVQNGIFKFLNSQTRRYTLYTPLNYLYYCVRRPTEFTAGFDHSGE